MKLEGANAAAAVEGMDKLPGIVNYFIGNDPEKWRTKIPTYAKVHYKDAYPGIDVAYYGNQGRLEYDFIVSPGVDPDQIKLAFEGASDIRMSDGGDLLLTTALGEVRLQKPVVYQLEKDGHKTLVAGNYVAKSKNSLVQIKLAAYDVSKPLIIDPVLDYATYLGGRLSDANPDIAVDASGNAYITGITNSLDFPVTGGAYDPTFNANPLCPGITVTNTTCNDPALIANLNVDIFVTKLNPTGTTLLYSSYLGGTGVEGTARITVDSLGQAFIAGQTRSADFPVTAGAFQTAFHPCPPPNQAPSNCSADAFVTKLNASGSALGYSTFLGGSSGEFAFGIAVDLAGNAYVAWSGFSSDFPTTAGVLDTSCGPSGVTKLNPSGTGLVWSTCLSPLAVNNFHEPRSIAVDSTGNVILAGDALGSLVTTANPAQPTFGGGGIDAFVWKLNPSGSALIFATFLGGSGAETAFGVAVDSADNIFVTGQTNSSNFPVTPGAFDTSHNGGFDIFVTKFNSVGTIQYSTYLGGSGDECFISNCDIGVDSGGQAYIAAETSSANFPTVNEIDSSLGGARDAVFSVLKADGSGLVSSTFLGGTGSESRVNLAMLTPGVAYLAGNTNSTNFPVTAGVYQPAANGGDEVFVLRISNKPLANAGPDQSVPEGTMVTLDGTGSTGGSLTYQWQQLTGPPVSLGSPTAAHPTFGAPHVPPAGATVTLQLIVCEGTSSNCSDPDTVNVHITNINQAPVSQAGPDQTVHESSPVQLDGTASFDPDIEPLTYTWLQLFGPPVTLANPLTGTPSFTAPAVGAGGAQVDFELIVTDPHGLNQSDYVSVFITNVNQPPVAHAGPDQTKNEHTLVTLDGSGSHDPDLNPLGYIWTQTGGPLVALTGGMTASPTFTAPEVGAGGALLTFQLVVNDGHVSSAADTVQVVVVNVNDPPVCTLAQASPNLLWPPNHTMSQISIMGVTDPNNHTQTMTYTAVTQDEPVNGIGDGDTSPDAVVAGNFILLRAERAGTGNGRVYVVHFTATDAEGAHCSGTVRVSVPHSKKNPAAEGPQLYNSFAP